MVAQFIILLLFAIDMKDYYLLDIQEDIRYYEQSYSGVKNKFFVNNDSIEKAANRLIEEFNLTRAESERQNRQNDE